MKREHNRLDDSPRGGWMHPWEVVYGPIWRWHTQRQLTGVAGSPLETSNVYQGA